MEICISTRLCYRFGIYNRHDLQKFVSCRNIVYANSIESIDRSISYPIVLSQLRYKVFADDLIKFVAEIL